MADMADVESLRVAMLPLLGLPSHGFPTDWLPTWIEFMPAQIPVRAISAAVQHLLMQNKQLPTLPEFMEYCERARDGMPLDMPVTSRREESALVLLNELSARYPDLKEFALPDVLLIAAAVASARAARSVGLEWTGDMMNVNFVNRAAMFGDASVQWVIESDQGRGIWSSLFTNS